MRPIKTMMIILLICTLGYGVYFLDTALPTGTGYASKYICSQTFLASRNPEVVFHDDVKPTHPLFSILSNTCLLYTSPSPRDRTRPRMPSSA